MDMSLCYVVNDQGLLTMLQRLLSWRVHKLFRRQVQRCWLRRTSLRKAYSRFCDKRLSKPNKSAFGRFFYQQHNRQEIADAAISLSV